VITIDAAAINAVCLTSQAAAEALILEKTTVTDNCTPANEIVKTIVHFEENCAFSRAVVEAVDGCGNKATGKTLRCILPGVRWGAPIHFTHNHPFFNHHLYTHI